VTKKPQCLPQLLDTEAPCWGGADKSKPKALHTSDGGVYGRDYTLTIDLPAMGSCLLRLTPEAPNPDAARLSANRALAQKRKAAKAAKTAAEVSDK
jgi:1,4-alpha-glucan branching enzyme